VLDWAPDRRAGDRRGQAVRVPVLATDIDPRAVKVARANADYNGVGGLVPRSMAADLHARDIVARAPFDLVLANILLRPLQRLAAPMARQIMPNARVVLSGILASQASAAVAAYRSQGLVLERAFRLDGWVTPVMHALAPLTRRRGTRFAPRGDHRRGESIKGRAERRTGGVSA
jgi:ribosomal protein L11 methyltransferase